MVIGILSNNNNNNNNNNNDNNNNNTLFRINLREERKKSQNQGLNGMWSAEYYIILHEREE